MHSATLLMHSAIEQISKLRANRIYKGSNCVNLKQNAYLLSNIDQNPRILTDLPNRTVMKGKNEVGSQHLSNYPVSA